MVVVVGLVVARGPRAGAGAPVRALALRAEDGVDVAALREQHRPELVGRVRARLPAAGAAALDLAEAEVVELALEARELAMAEVAVCGGVGTSSSAVTLK